MNYWSEISGNGRVLERLRALAAGGKIANAYLFDGAEGLGKKRAALLFAAASLCESAANEKPCGVCGACKKIFSNNHPDVVTVGLPKDKKTIGVDLAREKISEEAFIKPLLGAWKFFVVEDAQSLTAQAQNALLKVLEEPPDGVCFLLLSTDAGALLPTVLSRCARFSFKPLPKAALEAALRAERPGLGDKIPLLCALAQGSIGQARALAENEALDETKAATEAFYKTVWKRPEAAVEFLNFLNKNKNSIDFTAQFMILWFHGLFSLSLAAGDTRKQKALAKTLDALLLWRRRLSQNANFTAATLSALLAVREALLASRQTSPDAFA
jgi:DNA polymerase-3 subunit delta'